MFKLKMDLHILAEKWRTTGRKTRAASVEITNLLARGHMNGLSDGLEVAADDVHILLDEPEAPADSPSAPD